MRMVCFENYRYMGYCVVTLTKIIKMKGVIFMKNVKKLSKNGKNSVCFIIPKEILTTLNLTDNSLVKVEIKNGGIFIKEVKII